MFRLAVLGSARAQLFAIIAMSALATPSTVNGANRGSAYWHPWSEIGGYHSSRDEDSTGNDISGVTFTAGGQVCAVVSGRTFSGSTINFLDGTTVSPPTC